MQGGKVKKIKIF